MSSAIFIKPQYLKDRFGVNENISDDKVIPVIVFTQDMKILPIVGTALYDRLQAGIIANNLTASETTLLDDYLCKALAYYVLAELPFELGFQIWNKGLLRKTSDNSEVPTLSETQAYCQKQLDKAEWYGERAVKYLCENADSFSEYENPGDGSDTVHPERSAFQTNIYLDYEPKFKKDDWQWLDKIG